MEFYRKTWSVKRQLPNSGAEAPNEVENRHMHLRMACKNKLCFFFNAYTCLVHFCTASKFLVGTLATSSVSACQ